MPGSVVCGRCNTSLALGAATIDVHPPRANPLRKKIRRWNPVGRWLRQIRQEITSISLFRNAVKAVPSAQSFSTFIRAVLPGWPHFHLKQPARAWLYLGGFLALVIPGLFLWGSYWGSILLGLAFSVHASEAADLCTQSFADAGLRDRMVRGIAISITLWMIVYLPIQMVLERYALPFTMQVPMRPFPNGAVVLVNTTIRPHVGEVVLYDLPQYNRTMRREGDVVQIYTGAAIDRILVCPGDKLSFLNGTLLLNGAPSTALPLNPLRFPERWTLSVPTNCVFVLPSGALADRGINDPGTWNGLGVVPEDQLHGEAFAQTQPLSQWHIIR